MNRSFNIAGPCKPEIHYTVDPAVRWDMDLVLGHIARQEYIALHAPRQTGKTSCLLHLRDKLNAEGNFAAVYCNVEAGQAARSDVAAAMRAVGDALMEDLSPIIPELAEFRNREDYHRAAGPHGIITLLLREAAKKAQPKPLIVFFDEVDALFGDTLVSFFRQIRSDFPRRPKGFPQSVFFCGLRNVTDYRVGADGLPPIAGGSPFNIKAESLRLKDFDRPMMEELLSQRTSETGQMFLPEAREAIWQATQGQPWLVNALASQAVRNIAPDAATAITEPMIAQARENLILSRVTHLDQLAHKLEEPRVRAVVEPILAGTDLQSATGDDQEYVHDMGLIRRGENKEWVISNPIYKEVIPRELNATAQVNVAAHAATIAPGWLLPTGKLDFAVLMRRFVDFWRENGEALIRSVPYHEVSAQLSLMAFLQRLINGGGRIHREYALGSGRMDLCVEYAGDKFALEMKVWRVGRPNPLAKGLEQIDCYLDQLGLNTGWLVIFDQRENPKLPGADLGMEDVVSPSGRTLTLVKA
jgi:hypothetical protein